MTRQYFQIESRGTTPAFRVRASTYDEAARIGGYRLNGHRRTLVAIRVTGDEGKSGWYQGYLPCRTGGLSSDGRNFHVMEC